MMYIQQKRKGFQPYMFGEKCFRDAERERKRREKIRIQLRMNAIYIEKGIVEIKARGKS